MWLLCPAIFHVSVFIFFLGGIFRQFGGIFYNVGHKLLEVKRILFCDNGLAGLPVDRNCSGKHSEGVYAGNDDDDGIHLYPGDPDHKRRDQVYQLDPVSADLSAVSVVDGSAADRGNVCCQYDR